MMIQETYVNASKGYQFGESDQYKPFTDDVGVLFASLRKEYGRCVSRIYVDLKDAPVVPVGRVFQKRIKYEDSADTYIREVWVTLFEQEDTVTRQRHYKRIDK